MKKDSYYYGPGTTVDEEADIRVTLTTRIADFSYWGIFLKSFHFPQSRYQYWLDPAQENGDIKHNLIIILPEAVLIAWCIENAQNHIEDEHYEIIGTQAASEIVDILLDDDARLSGVDEGWEYLKICRRNHNEVDEANHMAWPENWTLALKVEMGGYLGRVESDYSIVKDQIGFLDQLRDDAFNIGVLNETLIIRNGNSSAHFLPLSVLTIQDDLIRHCKLPRSDAA